MYLNFRCFFCVFFKKAFVDNYLLFFYTEKEQAQDVAN